MLFRGTGICKINNIFKFLNIMHIFSIQYNFIELPEMYIQLDMLDDDYQN